MKLEESRLLITEQATFLRAKVGGCRFQTAQAKKGGTITTVNIGIFEAG